MIRQVIALGSWIESWVMPCFGGSCKDLLSFCDQAFGNDNYPHVEWSNITGTDQFLVVATGHRVECALRYATSYRVPLGFALASPLPRIPLPAPRPDPPLAPPRPSVPPRLLRPDAGLLVGAGVTNFDVSFDDDGFSTKDVSVVLPKTRELNPAP